jgi:hypothetical protein
MNRGPLYFVLALVLCAAGLFIVFGAAIGNQ